MSLNDKETVLLENSKVLIKLQLHECLLQFNEVADVVFHLLFFSEEVHHLGCELLLFIAETLLNYVILINQFVRWLKFYAGLFVAAFAGLAILLCRNLQLTNTCDFHLFAVTFWCSLFSQFYVWNVFQCWIPLRI
jgi:hypothetical protein